MLRQRASNSSLEAAAVGLADIDRRGQHQRRQLHALLDVMPLDVVDRGRIAKAVLEGALGADFVVVRSVGASLSAPGESHKLPGSLGGNAFTPPRRNPCDQVAYTRLVLSS